MFTVRGNPLIIWFRNSEKRWKKNHEREMKWTSCVYGYTKGSYGRMVVAKMLFFLGFNQNYGFERCVMACILKETRMR